MRAAKWLANTRRCGVVFAEFSTYAGEIPDAIGWTHMASTLIECKTSRTDFMADRKKPGRGESAGWGVGQYRFYMTPPGLVSVQELPSMWGLLEVHDKATRVVHEAGPQSNVNLNDERVMMYSALRRMEIRGLLKYAQRPIGCEPVLARCPCCSERYDDDLASCPVCDAMKGVE